MPTNSIPILDSELCANFDIHGIKLIEASAGTGKTYTIANLYLRFILAGYSPDQILVVTFTKAATEELKGRIRARLNDARNFLEKPDSFNDQFLEAIFSLGQPNEEILLRLQIAIRSMDEASIYTIHGFCQKLLLDNALLTNHAYELSVENDDFENWQQAFFDWWRANAYALSRVEYIHLSESIGNIEGMKNDLLKLKDDVELPLLPKADSDLKNVFNEWQYIQHSIENIKPLWHQFRETVLAQISESKALSKSKESPYNAKNLATLTVKLDAYLDTNLENIPVSYLGFISQSSLQKFLKPSHRDKQNDFSCVLFDSVEQTLELVQQYLLKLRTSAIHQARSFIQENIEKVKHKNNQLAFQDLLIHTAHALQQDIRGELTAALLKQFPVAMIDEFQDTDQQQFDIFKTIYQFNNDGNLILIGDPKQSIYAFRGGDIFTYLDARQSIELSLYSLNTNWRSSRSLVQAVNQLFSSNSNAFGNQDISYQLVEPSQKPASSLTQRNQQDPAITIWNIPPGDKGKPRSKDDSATLVSHAVAHQIQALIGPESTAKLDGELVKASDIAILVRTAREAETLQSILGSYHIPAIFQSRESVFHAREADDLRILLYAILDYRSQTAAKLGLASGLFNYSTQQIITIFEDESLWQNWLDDLSHLHQLWNRRGFIQMFQQMLVNLKVGEELLKQDHAHRRLTNLLHLGELLQDESRRNTGMHSLLNWYQGKLQTDTAEESKIRLESDESLIRIVTIHGSKGLEYPVVFLPFLWSARATKTGEGQMIMCHTDNNRKIADIGSPQWKKHLQLSLNEEDAEQMRILYVALTRARSKIYMAWGNIGGKSINSSRTALARLIHPAQYESQNSSKSEAGFDTNFDVTTDLQSLARSSDNSIEISPLPMTEGVEIEQSTTMISEAATRLSHCKNPPSNNWRINSFSGLTRNIHQVAHGGSNQNSGDLILDFQAGSKVGLFLHEVLENIDFTGDIDLQCQQQVPDRARAYGIPLEPSPDFITFWIKHILHCQLDHSGFSLSQISQPQRLNELPFDFTVANVDIEVLNQFFERPGEDPIAPLDVRNFDGLITGIIDLVFECNGKYFLADYKSNQLGHDLNDYTPERLRKAITDRRYDLQSMLYSLALHRYLQSRILNYDYEKHFGGSYYLFLRAMRDNTHTKFGVYFHREDYSVMNDFDRLFAE